MDARRALPPDEGSLLDAPQSSAPEDLALETDETHQLEGDASGEDDSTNLEGESLPDSDSVAAVEVTFPVSPGQQAGVPTPQTGVDPTTVLGEAVFAAMMPTAEGSEPEAEATAPATIKDAVAAVGRPAPVEQAVPATSDTPAPAEPKATAAIAEIGSPTSPATAAGPGIGGAEPVKASMPSIAEVQSSGRAVAGLESALPINATAPGPHSSSVYTGHDALSAPTGRDPLPVPTGPDALPALTGRAAVPVQTGLDAAPAQTGFDGPPGPVGAPAAEPMIAEKPRPSTDTEPRLLESGVAELTKALSPVSEFASGRVLAPSEAMGTARAPAPSPSEPASTPVPVVQQVPLAAVPIEIAVRSLAGANRFEITLDPGELGRIEVSLEIEDGTVRAQLVVDKVETLALLQRDAKTLERAFEQAGLKPSEGGIDLTLRDHHEGRGRERHEERSHRAGPATPDLAPRAEDEPAPRRLLWQTPRGVDLRV